MPQCSLNVSTFWFRLSADGRLYTAVGLTGPPPPEVLRSLAPPEEDDEEEEEEETLEENEATESVRSRTKEPTSPTSPKIVEELASLRWEVQQGQRTSFVASRK
eukprot:s4768_g3.t1